MTCGIYYCGLGLKSGYGVARLYITPFSVIPANPVSEYGTGAGIQELFENTGYRGLRRYDKSAGLIGLCKGLGLFM